LADTSPEITDILLDVMGNKPGHLQIEEAGLPTVDIKVSVSVWAASNPDEEPGPLEEIRRQLSDRFDLLSCMGRPNSVDIIAHILENNSHRLRINNTHNKDFQAGNQSNLRIQQHIVELAERYQQIYMPDFLRNFIARLYLKYNLESIRSIEAIQQAAILHSILQGRDKVMIRDVTKVIPMALKHRVDMDTLLRLINEVDNRIGKEDILRFTNREKNKRQGEDSSEHTTCLSELVNP